MEAVLTPLEGKKKKGASIFLFAIRHCTEREILV